MKFIHLSDLHLGKRLNEFSLLEDQEYILKEILQVIDDEKPDAVVIAGDIYDKSMPSAEAVEIFDDFLVSLAKRKLETYIIAGNHDSAERLAFANRLIDASGIHLSPVYNGEVKKYEYEDKDGIVNIYMLPFIKPAHVKRFFQDEEINSYTDAMRVAINSMNLDTSNRNILITHQFVTGAMKSESEEISVGGSDNVDAVVFEDFDYVALGHIHGPQNCGSNKVRYCGTPLKYSFSEATHKKSVTVVELGKKNELDVRTIDLVPNHDLVNIKGKFDEIMDKSYYEGTTLQEDYVRIILTDEDEIMDVFTKLRQVYHNLMKIEYDNRRTRTNNQIDGAEDIENKTPLDLFSELYEKQNGAPMTEEETKYMIDLIESIWED